VVGEPHCQAGAADLYPATRSKSRSAEQSCRLGRVPAEQLLVAAGVLGARAARQGPAGRPLRSSQLAWRLGVSDSYVRHLTWQLRRQTGQPLLAERLAATRQQLASPPPPVPPGDGRERDWLTAPTEPARRSKIGK
jgi:hypothetical protein